MAPHTLMIDIETHKYYAGFLDGEGCFSVASNGSPRVQVTNTHLPSLTNLKNQYGGTVRRKCPAQGNHRECFEWYIYSTGAIEVSKMLMPHLREKQVQAALLVNWWYETRKPVRETLNRMIKELKRV